jgi:hypothetical protein
MIYKKYMLIGVGVLIGASTGYAYWYYVGCTSGTCSITAVCYRSSIYGGAMGGLLASTFKSFKEKKI